MRSWKARLLMLLTSMGMLLTVLPVPAMADIDNDVGDIDHDIFHHHDVGFVDFDNNNILDDNCIGTTMFGHCTGVETNNGLFDNNNDELDTINVGPLECLVDEDNVEFCVDENGRIVFT